MIIPGKKYLQFKSQYSVAVILTFIGIFVAFTLIIAGFAIRTTLINLKYRDICPDYFASLNAFIVGPDRNGLDSISVTMHDNSNINCLYQTFTDKSGKFTLFNDFNSFALYETPFTYYVYVSAGGKQDTIRYKFRRYRVCHFEKLEGPDTIVFNQFVGQDITLTLNNVSRKKLSDISDDLPFKTMALSSRAPVYLQKSFSSWNAILFGSIEVNGKYAVLATVKGPTATAEMNSQAVYYIIDRNLDGDLNDEKPVKWYVIGNDPEPDCKVRTCFTDDSITSDDTVFRISMRLRGFDTETPVLDIRSEDVLCGEYLFNHRRLSAMLWNREMCGFRNWRSLAIGLDLNGDGTLDFREGSSEMFENISSFIVIDSSTIRIDTITGNGVTIHGTTMPVSCMKHTSVSSGDMAPIVSGFYKDEFNLFKTCSQNDIVILYFFEGNSQDYMSEDVLHSTIEGIKNHFNRVQLIGINRKVSGAPYCKVPVIEENQGWNGPIVRAFHNSKDRELVCIDSTGTIIVRGIPGNETLGMFYQRINIASP
jgi:hypothetical protein